MENPIIEIRSADDAAKWVGRKVCAGWRESPGGSSVPIRWRTLDCGGTYDRGLAWVTTVAAWVHDSLLLDGGVFGIWYEDGDPIVIELLDGAAHPRPEGEGWVWCQTAGDALERFAEVPCELSAAQGPYFAPYTTKLSPTPKARCVGCAVDDHALVDVDSRGGAWIREAPARVAPPVISITNVHIALRTDFSFSTDKTPERLAADAAQARYSEEAAALIATHRDLQAAEASADRADAQAAEDARFPLPEGWRWSGDGSVVRGPDGRCVWSYADTLEFNAGRDSAPLAVVRAVLARHDAKNS